MNKQDLISLIEKWAEFSEEQTETNLENFALWLLKHTQPRDERLAVERMAGYLSSRVERYTKLRVKGLFRDLPLIGYDDFILLNTLYHHPNITKKELYDLNIYDMNSGTQVLNRLKREGLLTDSRSPLDKRAFLLQITAKGKTVRNTAFERLGKEVKNKYVSLSQQELEQLLTTMKKLEKQLQELIAAQP